MGELYDLIVNKFLAATGEYLGALDWGYMITLVVLMSVLNTLFPDMTFKLFGLELKFNKRYRVVIVAMILGIVFYLLSDSYGKAAVKMYLQSGIAAMVLHSLLIDRIAKFLVDRVPAVSTLKDKLNTQKPKE